RRRPGARWTSSAGSSARRRYAGSASSRRCWPGAEPEPRTGRKGDHMSGIGPMAWRTLHSDRGILENKIERRTLRRVIGFSKPHRKLISIFLVGTVVDAGLVVVPPLLMQRLVDRGILGHDVSVV